MKLCLEYPLNITSAAFALKCLHNFRLELRNMSCIVHISFFNNFHRTQTMYRLIQFVFLLKNVVTSRNWLKTLASTLFV